MITCKRFCSLITDEREGGKSATALAHRWAPALLTACA